jgi:hypothetical protein
MLEQVFEPNIPEWRFVLGAAVVSEPLYDGARPYRVEPGPVIDIRYRDIAFASVGEGLGVNILRGENYRAGVAIGYDLGRPVSEAPNHLYGLGDISAAPFIKLFAGYVISKEVPIDLRVDVRRIVGGAGGLLGDAAARELENSFHARWPIDHVFRSPIHTKSVRRVQCSGVGLGISELQCPWRLKRRRTGLQRYPVHDASLVGKCGCSGKLAGRKCK